MSHCSNPSIISNFLEAEIFRLRHSGMLPYGRLIKTWEWDGVAGRMGIQIQARENEHHIHTRFGTCPALFASLIYRISEVIWIPFSAIASALKPSWKSCYANFCIQFKQYVPEVTHLLSTRYGVVSDELSSDSLLIDENIETNDFDYWDGRSWARG